MSNNPDRPARILIVEDDPGALENTRAIIESAGACKVEDATTGPDALTTAARFFPDIIISERSLKGGIDGLELCKRVKSDEALGGPIFMVLSTEGGADRRAEGLKEGADEFLTKPPDAGELLAKVNAFLRIKRLQDQLREDKRQLQELNRLLDMSFFDLVSLVRHLIDLHVPGSELRGDRVAKAAEWIGKRLSLEAPELQDLHIASALHDIGKVGLAEGLARKGTFDLEPEEWLVAGRHPILADLVVSSVERLKPVGTVLRHQLENFDGTGFPDHLSQHEIPLASRILRCVIGYEEYRESADPARPHRDLVTEMAEAHPGVFDPEIVQLLAEYLATNEDAAWMSDKKVVPVEELAEGMTLSADLVTSSGVKLLPAKSPLTARMIEHILRHHEMDPITAGAVVKKGS